MSTAAPRNFYDTQYHFDEDASRPDTARIWRSLRLLDPIENTDFLDLGCGAGWAARLAKDEARARRAIGLDFSRTALALARQHAPHILWLQADGTSLPIADASIDRLYCNGSLEHFPDVRQGLAQVHRVLRPAAKAVLIVPNFYVRTEQPMEFRTHYWGWKNLIQSAGLTVEQVRTDWGPPIFKNVNLKRALARTAGKILSAIPFLQYQFIFVVRKP